MANQVDICNLALDILGDDPISSLSGDSKQAGLLSRNWSYALDEVLRSFPWSFARKEVELEYTAGYGIYATSDIKTITAITQANPAVVTISNHGWQTGYLIKLYGIIGMTELNQRVFDIGLLTSSTFSLLGVNSQVYSAYVSGGSAVRYEVDPDYQNGYTYDVPADYLCDGKLHGFPKHSFEIIGWDNGTNKTKRLLTTVEGAILEYTAQFTASDVLKFPPHFIRALAATLARTIYRALAKKGAKSLQEIWAETGAIISAAHLSDARESKQKEGNYKDPLLEAGGFE